MEGSLVAFVNKDLQIATKNFSGKLGGGGFGSVFEGVLRDSSIVAVKKLESVSQGDKEFRLKSAPLGPSNILILYAFVGSVYTIKLNYWCNITCQMVLYIPIFYM